MLQRADLNADSVQFVLHDGRHAQVPLLWLRDHCSCAACLHPETRQRLSSTDALDAVAARGIRILDGGAALEIDWGQQPDGVAHRGVFPADVLQSALGIAPASVAERVLWDDALISGQVPAVPYAALMAPADRGDATLLEWLELIERFGFAFVEGVPATPEATQAVARRAAYIRETIFGGYYDFTANMEHKDTAYTSMAIGPHTDGTYSFDAPGYQMFHCLGLDCTGGDSVLVDGFKIAQIMAAEMPDLYRALTEIEVTGQYIDHEKGIHLKATRPLFRLDSAGELVQVSFNNLDRAPLFLPEPQLRRFYDAYLAFARLAEERRLQYRRRLEPGSLVLFDNWRLLHARDAYQGYRRLAGAYLNKEDVESRLRVLRMRAKALAIAA
jgi:trimethyllysine dioxygenase